MLMIWSSHETEEFKAQMKSMFSMSDLGLLSYYLGIQVKQTKEGITLNESSYAARILQKSGMQDCNPTQTPMEERLHFSKQSSNPTVQATMYRSLVRRRKLQNPTTIHIFDRKPPVWCDSVTDTHHFVK
jgi:hypothetical protein